LAIASANLDLSFAIEDTGIWGSLLIRIALSTASMISRLYGYLTIGGGRVRAGLQRSVPSCWLREIPLSFLVPEREAGYIGGAAIFANCCNFSVLF
jgi:uncharacterized membrane protein